MQRVSKRCARILWAWTVWVMLAACGSTATQSTGDAAGSDSVAADSAAVVDAAVDTSVATDVDGNLADSGADAAVDAAETTQDTLPDVDGGAAADAIDGADTDPGEEDGAAAIDCQATLSALQAEIAQLSTGHVACAHDADCTTVPTTTGCQGTCGVGLNTQSVAGFAAALAALDAKYCEKTDFTKFCGYSTPKCMAPAPGCVDGVCVYKK